MPYIVQNPRGLPAGTPILSQKQDDETFEQFYEGDTVTKRQFPEDGWAWALEQGYIKQIRGS